MHKEFLMGNEALALGAIAAGLKWRRARHTAESVRW